MFRFCGLTEIEAGGIGAQLRSTTLPLLTLLLTGNHIGDVGATYIADALLHNRTLLTLNLSANGIKDEGAASLSDALSNFQLSHQQLVERRQLLSKKWEKEKENIVPRTPLVEKNSRSRVSLAHSSSKMSATKDPRGMKDKGKVKDAKGKDKGGTTPGRKGKASKEPTLSEAKRGLQEAQKQPRSRGQSPSEHPEKGERARSRRNSLERETLERQGKFLQNKVTESQNVKGKYGRRRRRSRSDIPVINVEKQDYELSPLTKEAIYRDGHLWLPCNRTLMSLNLMRNKISERGMKSLLAAVEDQVMSDVTAKATQNREDLAPGLCRLEVLRNAVSDQCPTARELRRRMRLRDPLFRSPRMDLEKPCVTPCSIPPML
ncbi:leucine-rich repeat-containing protein 71-like [Littorina saxatilis]|uniref:leucine-rich repeat-containing protein 71-like n=1 Tax=Littorina saxatilis TaxID=31220 RepID=UPI0038B41B8A